MAGAIEIVGLDAGGTLISPVEPVGRTYARHAHEVGIHVDEPALERGFRVAFAGAPPLAAPSGASEGERLEFDRAWWWNVVARSFDHATGQPGFASAQGAAFDRLVRGVFDEFAEAAAWRIYPEVIEALDDLRGRGVKLGVLSNFDARLHPLLANLGLRELFAAVVTSSEAGAAKPDLRAFAALARALAAPRVDACLFVGDSLEEDALGAVQAGWRGVWLCRHPTEASRADTGVSRAASLLEVAGLL